ncbi:MAG: translesion error-prone DNA polymerase V autoproteolytic subunit [Candidatus Omnitrophica bacterium]|nr:translesion error-prone DNA polymerase V autoproteolytic subunit [Candidatus Omnitrophota bacterium]
MVEAIYSYDGTIPRGSQDKRHPAFLNPVHAGFPSPADDYLETSLDLNEHLVAHPSATFFVKVSGDSMTGAGIFSGDLLVVDRSLEPVNNDIVLAIFENEFTVKRFCRRGGRILLIPENPHYVPIEIGEGQDFEIWGVVAHVIHSTRKT